MLADSVVVKEATVNSLLKETTAEEQEKVIGVLAQSKSDEELKVRK